jgi:hypothetical protein
MLGVGCTASVAAPQDFAAHADGEDHFRSDLIEHVLLVVESLDDVGMFSQGVLEDSGSVEGDIGHIGTVPTRR